MWKIQLLTTCLLLVKIFHGQQYAHGCIADQKTREPLMFVVVGNREAKTGVETDEHGCFEIPVSGFPAELEFHQVGYQTKTIQVISSSEIMIYLEPLDFIFPQVDIKPAILETVAGNAKGSIWDYVWMDGRLLICEYGTSLSKSRIILMNTEGDTVAQCRAQQRPSSMFNDCMGNAYLVSKDSLWQFYLEEKQLKYWPAESAELVERALQYCVGENGKSIFFAIPGGAEFRIGQDIYAFNYKTNNDRMKYFIFDKKSEHMELVYEAVDDFVVNLKEDDVAYGYGPHRGPSGGFSEAVSKAFFYRVMCEEIDAPMFSLRDSLFIINNTNGRMEVLDENGKQVRSVHVDFTSEKTYERMSVSDEEGERLYILFEDKGMITLRRLDLSSGKLSESLTLPHPFPEHISISGNCIYYLHRDPENHEARLLSRLRMKKD